MKIIAADHYFSLAVRRRAGWRCQRCGAQHGVGSQGLHAAHYIGRGKWSTRFLPANVCCLCYGCHSFFHSRPAEFVEWFEARMKKPAVRALKRRAQDVVLDKRARKEIREIAAFYRAEYEAGTCRNYFEATE